MAAGDAGEDDEAIEKGSQQLGDERAASISEVRWATHSKWPPHAKCDES